MLCKDQSCCLLLLGLVGCALLAGSPQTSAEPPWMSEEAMRADFVGKTLQGYYRDGVTWSASYDEEGRYRVGEKELDGKELRAEGRWYFRGRAFCFFYGPPAWRLEERCVATVKVGANCYEFHRDWPDARMPSDGRGFSPEPRWHSRGWRQGEPSTCEEKATV